MALPNSPLAHVDAAPTVDVPDLDVSVPWDAPLDPGPASGLAPVMQPVGAGVFDAPAPYQAPVFTADQVDPGAAAYVTVGRVTLDALINGTVDQWKHLDSRVVTARGWVQEKLTADGLADQIAVARRGDAAARHEIASHIDRLLFQYLSKESLVRGADKAILVGLVINEIVGLGPIEPLWTDPGITEVIVNGPEEVFAERAGRLIPVPGARFRDPDHILEVINQVLNPLNRRLDPSNPLEDGRLPDGSRVNAVHQSIAPNGPALTIRRFRDTIYTLPDFVDMGIMTEEMACTLATLVKYKVNVLVTGGTGSGKTTFLNALSCCIPRNERIATIEDSLELRFHPEAHVVALEARPASASGRGEVTIRRLVKNAMRMRPDRVVVGEVRDAAALDMLTAMNTGHEGSMTTVHANTPQSVIGRLKTMVVQGGDMPSSEIDYLIAEAVEVIVYVRRFADGTRRVQSIYEVPPSDALLHGEPLVMQPLWEWHTTGEDDSGQMVGEYVQVADVSDRLVQDKGLDLFARLTMDEVREVSTLPFSPSAAG